MELPMKAYIYGTLIGLVNVTRPEVGSKVVKMTAQTLQQCLNEGNWRGAKLSVRYSKNIYFFFLNILTFEHILSFFFIH